MGKPKLQRAWGSKAGVARRAHAIRLLGTLRSICRRLRKLQADAVARAAYLDVEKQLAAMAGRYRR
jgi:hypothetical protein